MSTRTLWVILALVLGLGGLAWWQVGRERAGEFETERALVEGLRPERVQRVRIDNLERSLQLSIVRNADGGWDIVDPLAYPAESGVLELLLQVVSKNRASVVESAEPASLGLAPPRVVLELTEATPAGDVVHRLEVGLEDLDRKHGFVRVGGTIVRTSINLHTTLERDLPEWRRRRIVVVRPEEVLGLRRLGSLPAEDGGAAHDLRFEAGTTETGWRASSPWTADLDPARVGMLIGTLCYLQARDFVADSAIQLPPLRLEEPELRYELTLQDGSTVVLLFRRTPDGEGWLCMREGSTHAFLIDEMHVVFLTLPADGLLDLRLARVGADAVQRIELWRAGEHVRLARDGAKWTLARMEGGSPMEELRADPVAAGDLLAQIEAAQGAKFLLEGGVAEFTPAEPRLAWRAFTQSGEHGADFGAPAEATPGVQGRLFRRHGESVFGVAELAAVRIAERPLAELAERALVRLPEAGIARLELARGTWKRAFVRDAATGRWTAEGTQTEAPKPFLAALERLLSLRADVAVLPGESFELAEPWEVVIVDGGGVSTRYRVGPLAADPSRSGFDDGSRRGVITASRLVEDLAAIP